MISVAHVLLQVKPTNKIVSKNYQTTNFRVVYEGVNQVNVQAIRLGTTLTNIFKNTTFAIK
jgi:hypothetical protein